MDADCTAVEGADQRPILGVDDNIDIFFKEYLDNKQEEVRRKEIYQV